jgi:predicted O-methyltransferase YrrM
MELWPKEGRHLMSDEGAVIDILHLDGNHSAEASTRDVENYLPRLRRGGYLWFDDVNWPSTFAAQALVDAAGCVALGEVTTEGQACRLYRKA